MNSHSALAFLGICDQITHVSIPDRLGLPFPFYVTGKGITIRHTFLAIIPNQVARCDVGQGSPWCWHTDRWAVVAQSRLPRMPLQQFKVPWRTRREDSDSSNRGIILSPNHGWKEHILLFWRVFMVTPWSFSLSKPMGEGWWSSSCIPNRTGGKNKKSVRGDNLFSDQQCNKKAYGFVF